MIMNVSHKVSIALFAATLITLTPGASRAAGRMPNILLIITDQQRFDMLSCTGNPWLKTPHLDRLAARGMRFDRAFCAFPLCSPSRFAMFSGVMPSRIKQETNNVVPVPDDVLHNAMGAVLGRAGYETVYAGKMHLPCPNRPQSAGYGFQRNLTVDARDEAATQCAAYLREPHPKPFLLVASFNNPHDICSMGIREYTASQPVKKNPKKPGKEDEQALRCLDRALVRPAGVSDDEFFARLCPPLPVNVGESPALAAVMGSVAGMMAFEHTKWSDRDWQQHRWAYMRLTEQVDAQIGVVLEALRESGLENDTLVVATSDHGELDGSHRLGHKQFLYDEAMRVPMIVAWPGHTRPGAVDREHMVSTGLDLIPTLCDFAGVPVPPQLQGRSVKALSEGSPVAAWRSSLVIENRNGRAYRTADSKYVVYHGKNEEIKEGLIDLAADPGELRDVSAERDGAGRVAAARALMQTWYREHGETLDARYQVGDKSR